MIQIDEKEYLDINKLPLKYKRLLAKHGIPKDKFSIKDTVYKASKERLIDIFYNKCAFCEIKTETFHVEHYRPKGKVTEDENHGGYYWLAHEWSNFLLVCPTCNSELKRSHFPIHGQRITTILNGNIVETKFYAREVPLLLNPVFDKVDDCIDFKRSGKVVSIGNGINKKKGQHSIECYGLNRDKLLGIRKGILFSLQNDILKLYQNRELPTEVIIKHTIETIIGTKLWDKIVRPETSFLAFRIAILKNFIEFVIKKKIYIDGDEPVEIPQQDLWIKYAKEKLVSLLNQP